MHSHNHPLQSPLCLLLCQDACCLGPGADLPIAVMEHVCASLRPKGLLAVSLSGGEPFLRRDIGDVFTCIRNMGLGASVTTNGTIDLRSQLPHIKSNDIRVKVSLHGIGPIHDAIMGASVFSQASETLRLLIRERIRLTVNCMVCRMNVRHLDDLLDWILFLGVSRIRLVRCAARGTHHANGFLLDEVDESFYMDWLSKVRCSPVSGLTIRTTDYSETPYFVLEVDGRLYWSQIRRLRTY